MARFQGWFIPLKIDTNGPQWKEWSSRYRHDGDGIPIVYVVRADGEKLYARSGALPELELPAMLTGVLRQAGTIYNDAQLHLIAGTLERATAAVAAGDLAGASESIAKLSSLGAIGNLGSYAKVAQETDRLAEQLIEQGKKSLAAAREKLANKETRLEGALALAETRRSFIALPPLKDEIFKAVTIARNDPELRDIVKVANALDDARDLMRKPAGEKRAVATLRDVIEKNPGTDAASLALQWLREIDPGAAETASSTTAASKSPRSTGKPAVELDFDTWTSLSGSTVDARLVDFGYSTETKSSYIVLEKEDGTLVEVPYTSLSSQSQQLAKERVEQLKKAR